MQSEVVIQAEWFICPHSTGAVSTTMPILKQIKWKQITKLKINILWIAQVYSYVLLSLDSRNDYTVLGNSLIQVS